MRGPGDAATWLNLAGGPADMGSVNRKHLSLAALAVTLVALGIALLPFGWRDPYKSRVDCSPAVVSAWERTTPTPVDENARGAFAEYLRSTSRSRPTACAEKARIRLETSGVLLGLTAVGLAVGRRILRPEILSAA